MKYNKIEMNVIKYKWKIVECKFYIIIVFMERKYFNFKVCLNDFKIKYFISIIYFN